VKIRGLFIERFGALRDFEVCDLPDGLTVFIGPNGSGKSTLFAFLREILLGRTGADAEGSGARREHFGPWAGRLHCAVGDTPYTIQRSADLPQNVFEGVDARLLASLLMFDVRDLQEPAALSARAVRRRLRRVGLGRLRSIQRALEAVESRKSDVGQRVDRDSQQPPELQTRFDNAARAAVRLGELMATRTQARLALEHRSRTIAELQKHVAQYRALVDLAPVWHELTRARRELETIEPIDDFPADPEARLERALTARDAARRSAEQLENLNLHAPRAGVASAPAPAPLADSAVAWQQRWKEAAEAVCERERELEAATRAVHELEAVHTRISVTRTQAEPPSRVVLDEEARLLQHVQNTLAALAEDQASTKRWQEAIAERSAIIRTLEAESVPVPSSVFHRVGWIAAAVGVAAAGVQQAAGDPIGSGALIACSAASAVGAFVQRTRRASAFDEDSNRQARLTDTRTELEEACQNLLRHEERAARSRFDVSVDCARLGLPPMPSDAQLRERAQELEAQRQKRHDWDNADTTLAETVTALAGCEERRRNHAVALQAAQDHERQTIQQWYQWKVQTIDTVGSGRASADSVRAEAELLDNCARLKIQIGDYSQTATAWNVRARAGMAGGRDGSAAVADYAGQARVTISLEDSPAVQAARRRLRQCEDAIAQLFSQAGASDEAAFRARLAAYRRRLALSEKVRACESQSNERLRGEPAADAILRALPDAQAEEWGRRAAQSAQDLANAEAAREEALRHLRQLEEDVRAASAAAADLPALESERSGWANESLATAQDWRTLALAASLLSDARRHFERESIAPAVRRASATLSAVTLSRCERLALSEDERELRVLDVKSGWKRASELSRATIEQLHFSLRLGLADDAAPGLPWPLIIDDVLDHFDPQRGRAMASQIVELSRSHQTFIMTRRPETCDLLRSMEPSARVITMQEL
jgi:uncharacterized protein YhaN